MFLVSYARTEGLIELGITKISKYKGKLCELIILNMILKLLSITHLTIYLEM